MSGAVSGPLRVGLAGAGRIVRDGHVPAYLALRDIMTVSGVADPDPRNAAAVAGPLGLAPDRQFAALPEMLARLDIDLVVVASPSGEHHHAVTTALAHGAGVICEKPLCLNPAELAAIRAAAGDRGFVAVMHNYLAKPGWRQLLSVVRDGAIGTPLLARFEELSGDHWRLPGEPPVAWRQLAHQGGGPLTDNLYHTLYLAEQILGSEARGACGQQAALLHPYPAGDTAVITVSHGNGTLTQAMAAWCCQGWSRATAEVLGSEGALRYQYWDEPGVLRLDSGGPEKTITVPDAGDDLESGYVTSFREIAARFASGAPAPHGLADAERIMRVMAQVPAPGATGTGGQRGND